LTFRLVTFILFLGTNYIGFAQDSLPHLNRNPVKAMFFQRYLKVNNWMLFLIYGASNKVFHQYKTFISPIQKKGWELTFTDNFDSIDKMKWRLGQPWGYYHDASLHQHHSLKQVWCDSGYLHLGGAFEPQAFIHRDSNIVIPYGIGLINSDISFMQKYGFFEIRCKNPEGPATWPAFWLTGAHRWPPEIDIFEMYGKKTGTRIHKQISSIHYGVSETKSRGTLVRQIRLTKDTDKEFHVYACKWSPYFIKFYTDGILVKKQRINKHLRKFLNDEMVIIINNGFEAKYLKYLPKDFKGNVFMIDWVRAYKKIK